MLTETQQNTGKNMWIISCLLASYSDDYPSFWAEYLLVFASSWIASVVNICILCLVKGSRHHQNSVVLCFTELPVMHSHYGNNPLLHSSSNLLSLSGKIASSELLPNVSYHSVTYLVLKILRCLGRRNCIEMKAVYHFCLLP